jgi:hypothetical protein
MAEKIPQERLFKLTSVVKAHGGKVLSDKWVSKKDQKVSLQCEFGHKFEPNINNVTREKKPSWCSHPDCLRKRISNAKTIDNLSYDKRQDLVKQIIDIRNGVLIEGDPGSSSEYLTIQCAENHKPFKKRPKRIIDGYWCKECDAQDKRNAEFDRCSAYAKSKAGELLSSEYVNAKSLLDWRCGNCGYEWPASQDSVLNQNTWCPECGGSRPLGEAEIKAIVMPYIIRNKYEFVAVSRIDYGNKRDWKIEYKCNLGHFNSTRLHYFKSQNGQVCDTCNKGSKPELITRQILEFLTGKTFIKIRPAWLVSSDGLRLELDGFNEELNLGFEYQGEQHYKFVPHFHASKGEFDLQLKRDQEKRELCSLNDVDLLEIPFSVSTEELESYLRSKLDEIGIVVKQKQRFDLNDALINEEYEYQELAKLAQSRGGRLLSGKYVSSELKLEWKCSNPDHKSWFQKASVIKKGSWCNECGVEITGQKNRTSTSSLKDICSAHLGELIQESKDSQGSLTYDVVCVNGHEFQKTAALLKKGSWCSKCSKLIAGDKYRSSIDDIKKSAKAKNVKLISKYYLNNRVSLLWKCSEEHVWTASPPNVLKSKKNGCPECSWKKNKFTDSVETFLEEEKLAFLKHKENVSKAKRALRSFTKWNKALKNNRKR